MHYGRSSYCSAMLLNGLKNYIEKGVVVPFEDKGVKLKSWEFDAEILPTTIKLLVQHCI